MLRNKLTFHFNFSDMKWASGAPGGGRKQNFVGIRPVAKNLEDLDGITKVCVACEINRTNIFTLRGYCEGSYLDAEYFPTMYGGYVGFMGNMVSIRYNRLC